jgi:uracil-DNA glycosylase
LSLLGGFGFESAFSRCYMFMPSPRDSGEIFAMLTQHSASGSMLGCHRTPYGLKSESMTLTADNKAELRNRLQFYRELGIGPLYRRAVANNPPHDSALEPVGAAASLTDELVAFQGEASQEGYLPTAGDRESLLRVIRDDIGSNCERCKLSRLGRKQIVFGTGDPHAELMFIGEGPGADEDAQGLPFVGRAGQLLNNMITAMGLQREQVYIANIVKCRPPQNRTPERDECDTCSPFLMRQIGVVRPKVIVALGATAAKNLLGVQDSMASLRGRFYDFSPPGEVDENGDPLVCKLAVTYHPAFLLRDPRQKKETWKDLQMVMKYLGLQTPARKESE